MPDDHFAKSIVRQMICRQPLQRIKLSVVMELMQPLLDIRYDSTEELGQGWFGPVFRGTYKHDKPAAVKRVRFCHSDMVERGLVEEPFHRLDHPNVVKVFDFYEDSKNIM